MKNSFKKEFIPPRILQKVHFIPERSFLVRSAIVNIEQIESTGQDVESLDFGDSDQYSSYWEE